jgi:hypothetical protein
MLACFYMIHTDFKQEKMKLKKCKQVVTNSKFCIFLGTSLQDGVIKFFLHTLLMKDLRFADLIKQDSSISNR